MSITMASIAAKYAVFGLAMVMSILGIPFGMIALAELARRVERRTGWWAIVGPRLDRWWFPIAWCVGGPLSLGLATLAMLQGQPSPGDKTWIPGEFSFGCFASAASFTWAIPAICKRAFERPTREVLHEGQFTFVFVVEILLAFLGDPLYVGTVVAAYVLTAAIGAVRDP